MVSWCDLNHDIDLRFSRLNFENNFIWGITSDFTCRCRRVINFRFIETCYSRQTCPFGFPCRQITNLWRKPLNQSFLVMQVLWLNGVGALDVIFSGKIVTYLPSFTWSGNDTRSPQGLVCQRQCREAPNLSLLKLGWDRDTLLMLYQAIVCSQLDYSCIVFGPASNLGQLDSIHNTGLRPGTHDYNPKSHNLIAPLKIKNG